MRDIEIKLDSPSAAAPSTVSQDTAVARRERLAIAAILVVQCCILISLAWRTGVTIDEPSHLLSASLYWQGADRLSPGDMPPLIKIAGGWVPVLQKLPIPYDHPTWAAQKEWEIAQEMMARLSGDQIHKHFFAARLPLLIFPLLTTFLLWNWGRQLFSPLTGIAIALLFALSPNALGHGALFKNDLAATFAYAFFWFRAWKFWRMPSIRNTGWLAAALLLGMLAKMSLFVLALIGPALVIARFLTARPLKYRIAAGAAAALILIPYLGVNAAWQFDSRPLTPADWEPWKASPHIPDLFVFAAQTLGQLPTPPRLWQGIVSLIQSNANAQAVYLLGEIHPAGHPLYFLIALALKIPIPLQILIVSGFALAWWHFARRRLRTESLLWLTPPLLYLTLASLSGLQLGVRLVLPSFVLLLLYAGAAIEWLRPRRIAVVVPILLVWLGARTMVCYPLYISYFNLWCGGPENAVNLLSDSNLDWGQDLPRLGSFVRDQNIPKIYLSYFGMDNPFAHIPETRLELVAPPWSDQWAQGTQLHPKPGLYAISATLLTGQFFAERYRNYYATFRAMKPVARAGNSIYIYRVP